MTDHNFDIKEIPELTGSRFMLKSDIGQYYQIKQELYEVLSLKNGGLTDDEIVVEMNKNHPATFYSKKIISDAIDNAKSLKYRFNSPSTTHAFWFKLTFCKGIHLKLLYQWLAVLFRAPVAKAITAILFILSTITLFKLWQDYITIIFAREWIQRSVAHTASLYCLLIGTIFIHELGHGTAAKYYQLQPPDIGIGIYRFMPVMYAKVNDIWTLPTTQRIVINLAGIYFQLIVNGIFCLLAIYKIGGHIFVVALLFNTCSILLSITPLFHSDGYWVLCDLLNIPNLSKLSNPIHLIRWHRGNRSDTNRIVIAYSIFKVIAGISLVSFLVSRLF